MFEYYDNTLCVRGNWLEEVGVVSISNLKFLSHTGKIKKARSARGLFYTSTTAFRNVFAISLNTIYK